MSHSSGQEDCLQMFPKFMIYYSQQVLTFILAKFLPFSIRILRKKSAVLQLIIQDSIYKNIDQKEIEQIVALNADFSKAVSGSPTVDWKKSNFGIGGILFELLVSYISDGEQRVKRGR